MIFQHFPNTNVWGCKFDLPYKGQKSTYDHHLNKLGRPWVLDAIYQDSASKPSWFWRSVSSVLPYMGMAAILINGAEPFEKIVNTLSTKGLTWNQVKIVQAVSEKTVKNYTILYMYIAQG